MLSFSSNRFGLVQDHTSSPNSRYKWSRTSLHSLFGWKPQPRLVGGYNNLQSCIYYLLIVIRRINSITGSPAVSNSTPEQQYFDLMHLVCVFMKSGLNFYLFTVFFFKESVFWHHHIDVVSSVSCFKPHLNGTFLFASHLKHQLVYQIDNLCWIAVSYQTE